LDLYYLIQELKVIENSKVDRIYHSKDTQEELMIILHVSGKGKHVLRILLPSMIFIEDTKQDQGIATGFCMMLRKYLEGSLLKSIDQKDFERILELRFKIKDKEFLLIIELFSKGNIIFCDSEGKIMNLLYAQRWKDRELKIGNEYKMPVHDNLMNIDYEKFISIIKNSKKYSIVKSLAIELSLGGVYAEEICKDINIEKTDKIIDDKRLKELFKAYKELFNKKISANSVGKNAFPFELRNVDAGKKYYESFNEAIINNLEIEDKNEELISEQRNKILKVIEEQEKNLGQLQIEMEDNQKKAEFIYEHYDAIRDIIKIIKEARKKYSWREIRERLNADKEYSSLIKDIDEKENKIILDLK